MARLPRLAVAGQHHLVLLRGLDHQPIVIDDEDRRRCLASLREAALPLGLAIHAYALLDDRLRLLVTPREPADIGRLIQGLGRRYVGIFNRRHGRRGTLWDGRFRATVVQPGHHALQALLFIDTEPVRQGAVASADEHRWSSAAHHVGRVRDSLVSPLPDYWQLGNTPFDRETAWARRLADGLAEREAKRLAEASHKAWAVGDAAFLATLAAQADRPVVPRRRGRPAKVTP